MFLHIGSSQIVFNNELIGIFDYNLNLNNTNLTLKDKHKSAFLPAELGSEKPKSVILTDHNLYFSPISAITLARRQKSASKRIR